ncbi:hypothetical protein EXIGLDRAFT_728688 [Exidia glandulosa HHB12029]|uniref:Uncharacterized protein n=1 Tax=Exidia glandulosa HHB12029 TaxID=1314781 RepID=A0A165LRM7_EXIGL|nr:hypothetical protein EXIGLDRAFT_728688 [Exidia glandulosa HHB12029]
MFSNGRPQWTQSPEDFLWLLPSSAIILDFALFTGFGFIHRDSKEMIEAELSPESGSSTLR